MVFTYLTALILRVVMQVAYHTAGWLAAEELPVWAGIQIAGTLRILGTHHATRRTKSEDNHSTQEGHMRKRTGFLIAIAALLVTFGTVSANGGRPLSASLSGAAEVPGPGDPDGSGSASMRLNQGQGEICYDLSVSNITPATAAHIHVGSAGVAGPVVVHLAAPSSGSSSACTSVNPDLIKAIRQDPANYYVNVHNAAFPAGAVRGQLSK
jgi:hypothetical protein